MRLSRARAAFVVMLAVLHLASGVVAAFAPCCDTETSGELMECCLNGGPDHVCPHMAKRAQPSSSAGIDATCSAGHDSGVPVMGFAGVPPDAGSTLWPVLTSTTLDAFEETAVACDVHPPTPPPKI